MALRVGIMEMTKLVFVEDCLILIMYIEITIIAIWLFYPLIMYQFEIMTVFNEHRLKDCMECAKIAGCFC